LLLLWAFTSIAAKKDLPRFVTIKSNEVNTRVGPGLQYPIAAIFLNPAEPVEILEESNNWRKIKDFDGEISWVHVSLLSRKRSVIVNSALPTCLFKTPFNNSEVIGQVFPNVRCEFLDYCSKNMCKVRCKGYKGWIIKDNLWGIYEYELKKDSTLTVYLKSLF
jgi:SH3-like domain-containing protein